MTSERSKRRTVPLTISPTRSLNSVKQHGFFGLPNLLHQGLLGVLGSHAAKTCGSDFLFQLIARLSRPA